MDIAWFPSIGKYIPTGNVSECLFFYTLFNAVNYQTSVSMPIWEVKISISLNEVSIFSYLERPFTLLFLRTLRYPLPRLGWSPEQAGTATQLFPWAPFSNSTLWTGAFHSISNCFRHPDPFSFPWSPWIPSF